jgi:hypothetical protein
MEEMAAKESAVAEPLVQELAGKIAGATAADKEGKTAAVFDFQPEAIGMKHGPEHLELGALLASTATLVAIAAPVCPGAVGSRRWLG